MNMLLISSDTELAEEMTRSMLQAGDQLHIESMLSMTEQHSAEMMHDIVIASDRMVAIEDWEVGHAARARRIILLSNRHDAIQYEVDLKAALSEGWEVVPPGLTVKQVVNRLSKMIYGDAGQQVTSQSQGVIQFLGTTPNIGVTVAAYGTAVQLATRTEAKVAYICLNLKSSKIHRYLGAGLDDSHPTIDGLRAELRSGSLTGSRLAKQAAVDHQLPNLFVIQGNRQREQSDYYTIEEIERLLLAAKEVFDYCVVETGAYWDNAATIGVIRQAKQRILVTTPQLSHFQEDTHRWFGTLQSLFDLSRKDFDLLVTQHGSDSLYNPRQISRELGISRIGVIRKSHNLDKLLSEGQLRQAVTQPGAISSDLSRLASALLTLHGETRVRIAKTAGRRGSWLLGLPSYLTGGRLAVERRGS